MTIDGAGTASILVRSDSAEQTACMGRLLAPLLAPGDVVSFAGDLGAGKTQMVKGLAAGLGVREPITSPTFNILLVHGGRLVLNHLDLYRLDRVEQLEDVDFWGTLESGGVSVVEWGDRFCEALPAHTLHVTIRITSDEGREIELRGGDPRSVALARMWANACEAADAS